MRLPTRRRLDGVRQGGGGGRDERVPAARDPLLRSRAGLVHADASGLRRRYSTPARDRGPERGAVAPSVGRPRDRCSSGDTRRCLVDAGSSWVPPITEDRESSWGAGPRSNGTRRHSSRSALGLPGGSMNACRRYGLPPSALRSKEMRFCIWTSGATTSASQTAERSSSTGTSCISETPTSTSPAGPHRSIWRAGRRHRSSFRALVGWPPCSPDSSRRAQGSRRRPRLPAFERFSSRRHAWRSPGLCANSD